MEEYEELATATPYESSNDETNSEGDGIRKHIRQDTLDEFLICPGCSNSLIKPITLPCLHSFCMNCLQVNHRIQRQRQDDMRARTRREEEQLVRSTSSVEEIQSFSITGLQADYHDIPSTGIYEDERGVATDHLPLYFCCPLKNCKGSTAIPLANPERLLELEANEPLCNIQYTLSMKRDLPRGRVQCRVCGTRPAIGVCCNKDCNNQPYCGHCLEFHLSDNRAHHIVYPNPQHPNKDTVEEGIAGESGTDSDHAQVEIANNTAQVKLKMTFNDLKQYDILCKHDGHERFFRNLYCEDHQKVICLACTASGGNHRRCENIVNTADKYDTCMAATERKLMEMEKLHDYFKAAIKTTEEVKRALEDKVDKVKETIEDKYQMLMEQLTAHKDDLLMKCNTIYQHKTEELEQHLVILNQVAKKCGHSINYTSKIKDWAIASEFMMLRKQIDERLNELTNRYSKYRCETNEDDCIFLEENKEFSTANAIGRVFSTPSVKNFRISAITSLPSARQPFYLSVTIHDSVGNKLLCHSMMPKLRAIIRHVDEEDVIEGYVDRDVNRGCYNVMVYPNGTGLHELCIFQPLNPPYNRYMVGGKKYIINVDA